MRPKHVRVFMAEHKHLPDFHAPPHVQPRPSAAARGCGTAVARLQGRECTKVDSVSGEKLLPCVVRGQHERLVDAHCAHVRRSGSLCQWPELGCRCCPHGRLHTDRVRRPACGQHHTDRRSGVCMVRIWQPDKDCCTRFLQRAKRFVQACTRPWRRYRQHTLRNMTDCSLPVGGIAAAAAHNKRVLAHITHDMELVGKLLRGRRSHGDCAVDTCGAIAQGDLE
mmetsp:Transcript_47435/g.119473  ORF Transcript_47435/g.119473 Transcript_47435/m.119473 type:complete len:223 (-) Transcript_47435:760-1428(-)